ITWFLLFWCALITETDRKSQQFGVKLKHYFNELCAACKAACQNLINRAFVWGSITVPFKSGPQDLSSSYVAILFYPDDPRHDPDPRLARHGAGGYGQGRRIQPEIRQQVDARPGHATGHRPRLVRAGASYVVRLTA